MKPTEEFKMRYVYKHRKTGEIKFHVEDIGTLENGSAKNMRYIFREHGYEFVGRNLYSTVDLYSKATDAVKGVELYEGDIVEVEGRWNTKWLAVVKFGRYMQDGSGGEYEGTECIGFYIEVIDPDQVDEWDCRFISEYQKQMSLLECSSLEWTGKNVYSHPELVKGDK
ncbi:hypothetical protein ACFRGK_03870 [Bacillus subtilis]